MKQLIFLHIGIKGFLQDPINNFLKFLELLLSVYHKSSFGYSEKSYVITIKGRLTSKFTFTDANQLKKDIGHVNYLTQHNGVYIF